MRKIVKNLLGYATILTLLVAFGIKTEVKANNSSAHPDQWTWCKDINDSRCCVVWGWDCAPDIDPQN